ncbi:hypothetical protein [Chroococcus sp. FPU101]|uniref:hypothetical protein n=1 Tax=Chroococcus sp. FPU101 TaxID=1974212 RepID=UPI001A8FA434|nr:hypothetical protein [Chroococcus sp. FPU101]
MYNKSLQTIDKTAIIIILIFCLVIGGLIWGEQWCGTTCSFVSKPKVKEFSWQNQQIGIEDRAFVLTFNRPMEIASIEQNLQISPTLPGKISWAGRRLAYTLTVPIPYGESYQLQLQGGRERSHQSDQMGVVMQPFVGTFKSRDRAFAYIGTNQAEQGQLVFYNLTQKKKFLLTPPTLNIVDFKFYPNGDKILFSAASKNRGIQGLTELQLYQVTTGLDQDLSKPFEPKIEVILDNKEYQNNQFDLSSDGETIVVQRLNRSNPADFDLWIIKPGTQPKRLNLPGGEFLITPDGQTLAVTKGEGVAIVPLKPDTEVLDFLPKFGRVLNFSADGAAAAMVNFNMENSRLRYTKSLFYVNNQGIQKELLNIDGSILDCKFNPSGSHLYCLLTELLPSKDYQEKPYLAKIDIKTAQVLPLLELPNYRDINISLSPDGLAILFDQILTSNNPSLNDAPVSDAGEAIIGGRLWLLIPPTREGTEVTQPDLEELPLVGFHPQWSP